MRPATPSVGESPLAFADALETRGGARLDRWFLATRRPVFYLGVPLSLVLVLRQGMWGA